MVWRGFALIALCLALASAAAAGPWATISVPVGGVFSLELPARPARAMGWRLAGDLPEGRLELESVRYRQGEADTATDRGPGWRSGPSRPCGPAPTPSCWNTGGPGARR